MNLEEKIRSLVIKLEDIQMKIKKINRDMGYTNIDGKEFQALFKEACDVQKNIFELKAAWDRYSDEGMKG